MRTKRTILTAWAALTILVFNFTPVQAQKVIPGEKLHYKIAFSSFLTGSVKGGEATLSVSSQTVKANGNDSYHATLEGGTTGLIERVYRVQNYYETFMNPTTLAPHMYRQAVIENKYRSNDTVYFNQTTRMASYKGKQIAIPNNTHDFVSMIYYVRSLDVNKLKSGDTFQIPFFTSNKIINSQVVYEGIETVRVNGRDVQCHAYKPQMVKGKVFNQDYPATIWISTDSKKLPMLIEARMRVGKVKMELLREG